MVRRIVAPVVVVDRRLDHESDRDGGEGQDGEEVEEGHARASNCSNARRISGSAASVSDEVAGE